jgi:hypothetical protein
MNSEETLAHKRRMAAKLLYAKFVRASTELQSIPSPIDYEGARLIYERRELRKGYFFSGAFSTCGGETYTFPFSIAFCLRNGVLTSYTTNLALSLRLSTAGRALVFLGVMDYLQTCGFVPDKTMERHAGWIERHAMNAARSEAAQKYHLFSRGALSNLPYDLSQEVAAALGITSEAVAV